jgi:hypothetical protein
MDSQADLKLNDAQMAVLLEHYPVIDALFELSESADFKAAFGEMPLSEVLQRLEATLADEDDDEENDPVLRARYQRMQAEMESGDHTEMIRKLRESASFWDEELSK